jgi:hypothetical protein
VTGLTSAELHSLRYCCEVARYTLARRDRGVPDWLPGLVGKLDTLAAVPAREVERSTPAGELDLTGWITSAQAAEHLNCTKRWASEIAADLGGVLHGGRWWIPKHNVLEYAKTKGRQRK